MEQLRSDRLFGRMEPLHGYYEQSCTNVWDSVIHCYWLTKGDLSIKSEGFQREPQGYKCDVAQLATILECSNELSAVRHPDIALLAVPTTC